MGDELIPCVCLEFSASTQAHMDSKFGSCPLCHGTGACTKAAAEEFAFAWIVETEGESPVASAMNKVAQETTCEHQWWSPTDWIPWEFCHGCGKERKKARE